MRIAVDLTGVVGGGVTTAARETLGAWAAAFPEDEWLFTTSPGLHRSWQRRLRSTGRVVVVPGADHLPGKIMAQNIGVTPLVRRFHPDAYYTPTTVVPVGLPRVPSVAVLHDLRSWERPEEFSPVQRAYRSIAFRRSARRVRHLVTPAPHVAAQAQARFGLPAGRVVTIAHGADHVDSWRDAPAPDEPGRYALTFGHWANKKPDLALAAWARLEGQGGPSDVRLVVVGVPEGARPGLRAAATRLGIGDRVEIREFVDEQSFVALFAHAAAILLLSTHEGFGLPLVEAARLGIPGVAVAGTGIESAVSASTVLAEAATDTVLAEAVARALRGPVPALAPSDPASRTWREAATETRALLAP